jgi:cobalt ECF transporter T component CbiQ
VETHAHGSSKSKAPYQGLLGSLIGSLENAEGHAGDAEDLAGRKGLLQLLDPRIKVVALLALIIAVTASHSLVALAVLFALAVILAALSRLSPVRLFRQVWLGVLLFSGAIVLPAVFLVPGEALVHLPILGWPVTVQGVKSAAFVIGRAETSATFAVLLILTTPWPHVLKALSSLGVPVAVVALLGMTYRYVFVLLRMATDLADARRSRVMSGMNRKARRHLLLSTIGVLLSKSMALATDIHMAMLSRGYNGEVRLLDDFRTRPRDWMFLAAALAVPAFTLGIQI